MQEFQAHFDQFTVHLEVDEDESHCFVIDEKMNTSGSLEYLLGYGGLYDNMHNFYEVDSHRINEIEQWARAHGY